MLNYLVEFIGTFVFLSVILRTGEALPIAVALAAVIYFGGAVSGGHFNPAVSTMMLLKNNLERRRLHTIRRIPSIRWCMCFIFLSND